MLNSQLEVDEKTVNSLNCPRNAEEVYYFGMFLEGSMDRIYHDLGFGDRPKCNSYRDEIETLVKTYLNQSLGHFYKTGGLEREVPVSDFDAQSIQPSFNKMVANFYDQVDTLTYIASQGEMSAYELEVECSNYMVGLLSILERLYTVDEVREAFAELIDLEKARLQ